MAECQMCPHCGKDVNKPKEEPTWNCRQCRFLLKEKDLDHCFAVFGENYGGSGEVFTPYCSVDCAKEFISTATGQPWCKYDEYIIAVANYGKENAPRSLVWDRQIGFTKNWTGNLFSSEGL